MVKVRKSISGVFKKLDRFGYTIEMHYKGESAFTTCFGGFASLFIYVLIIINSINVMSDFINNEN